MGAFTFRRRTGQRHRAKGSVQDGAGECFRESDHEQGGNIHNPQVLCRTDHSVAENFPSGATRFPGSGQTRS